MEGHAFLGYWRTEDALVNIAHTDTSDVINLIDLGMVQLVETTMATDGERTRQFSETHRPPYSTYVTGDLDKVDAVFDVFPARRCGVPLPAISRQSSGEVQVVESPLRTTAPRQFAIHPGGSSNRRPGLGSRRA